MAADTNEESMWDWWPTVEEAGVQVTALQARQAGLLLSQREHKWRATGEPLLARRDYREVQDNQAFQEMCAPGKAWLEHSLLVEVLAPFMAPPSAGNMYWRQGSPVAKYIDWRGVAMGCWGDRQCRRTALPHGIQICEDLAMVGLARKPVMDGDYQEPNNWILDTV
eukprot:4349689-Amphidinium_carterae.1